MTLRIIEEVSDNTAPPALPGVGEVRRWGFSGHGFGELPGSQWVDAGHIASGQVLYEPSVWKQASEPASVTEPDRSREFLFAENSSLLVVSDPPALQSSDPALEEAASTEQPPSALDANEKLAAGNALLVELLAASESSEFRLGYENRLTRILSMEYEKDADSLLKAAAQFLRIEHVDVEGKAEMLGWLGQVGDPGSRTERRKLIETHLMDKSVSVRDGALLGLAYLGSRDSLNSLRRAEREEKVPELRRTISGLIEHLSA